MIIMILYKVFIIVPDVGNGVGETLHFRQQDLSKMGSFLTYLRIFGYEIITSLPQYKIA
jgi:hypothetical protein